MRSHRTPAFEESFELLKRQFSSSPILADFNPDAATKVETDDSNFAKCGVLSQLHTAVNKWLRVAFYFKKFNTAVCNYKVHYKELGVIVASSCNTSM